MNASAAAGRPLWLKALITLAFLVCLLNLAAFLYGLTLPNEWNAAASIEIAARPEAVYPRLASAKRWAEWSSWGSAGDPTVELAYAGPDVGAGSAFSWRGERLGLGKLTITEALPETGVRYELDLQNSAFSKDGRIALKPIGGGTRVDWTDRGELDSTLGRFFRGRLEDSVSNEFRTSLLRLKEAVESGAESTP